jgi:hypothetical protein
MSLSYQAKNQRPSKMASQSRRARRAAVALLVFLFASADASLAHALHGPVCTTGVGSNVPAWTVTCNGGKPSIANKGSGGLIHPEIVPIFWGPTSYWTTSLVGQWIGTIQSIVNGAYLSGTSQYGVGGAVIGRARMVPTARTYSSTTPAVSLCENQNSCSPSHPSCSDNSTCGSGNIMNVVNAELAAGVIPALNEYADMLYVVIAPAGTLGSGFNENGYCNSSCGGPTGTYHLVWAENNLGTLAHELIESTTGNISNNNCYWDYAGPCTTNANCATGYTCKTTVGLCQGASCTTNANCATGQTCINNLCINENTQQSSQIADICQCWSEQQSGGFDNSSQNFYPAYWSQADGGGECIIPEGWQNLYQYSGTPYVWSTIYNGELRQIEAGAFGLVATNNVSTNNQDNLILYSGSGTTWNQIGGPGAMFGVTGSGVVAMAPDASAVWYYEHSSWGSGPIGGVSSSVYGSNNGDSNILATDFDGDPWLYIDSNWQEIGGPSDEFVFNGLGITALSLNHQGVWLNDELPCTSCWQQIGDSASEIFGVDDIGSVGVGMTALAATKDVYYFAVDSFDWYQQGGPGTMFVLAGANNLFGLNPSSGGVFQSTNVQATNPPWTQVGNSAGRLVGQGGSLYATGGYAL